jgi:hypothetical protein
MPRFHTPWPGLGHFTYNVRPAFCTRSHLLLLGDAQLCCAECATLVIETTVLHANTWQASAPCAHCRGSHDIHRAHLLAAPLTSRFSDSCTLRWQAPCSLTALRCRHILLRFQRRLGSTCCALRSVLGPGDVCGIHCCARQDNRRCFIVLGSLTIHIHVAGCQRCGSCSCSICPSAHWLGVCA